MASNSYGLSAAQSNKDSSMPRPETLRVVFFTASYFVLDGVSLTIRKLMAALKQVCSWLVVVCASGPARCNAICWALVMVVTFHANECCTPKSTGWS